MSRSLPAEHADHADEESELNRKVAKVGKRTTLCPLEMEAVLLCSKIRVIDNALAILIRGLPQEPVPGRLRAANRRWFWSFVKSMPAFELVYGNRWKRWKR